MRSPTGKALVSPSKGLHSPRGNLGARHRTLSDKVLHRYLNARMILGGCLLLVALLVFGQLGAHPNRQVPYTDLLLLSKLRALSCTASHECSWFCQAAEVILRILATGNQRSVWTTV